MGPVSTCRDKNVFSHCILPCPFPAASPSTPQYLEMRQCLAGPSFLTFHIYCTMHTQSSSLSLILAFPMFPTTEVDDALHLPLQRALYHALSLQRKVSPQLLQPEIRKQALTFISPLSPPLLSPDDHQLPNTSS